MCANSGVGVPSAWKIRTCVGVFDKCSSARMTCVMPNAASSTRFAISRLKACPMMSATPGLTDSSANSRLTGVKAATFSTGVYIPELVFFAF